MWHNFLPLFLSIRGHLQTEFSILNVIVALSGWVGGGRVEAMTLRIIVGINCLTLL